MLCTLEYEETLFERGFVSICGVDEVGRGCLAGPVLAAAVRLPRGFLLPGINDSKKLTPVKREKLFSEITENPEIAWAVAEIDAGGIDRMNILQASREAMRMAVLGLFPAADAALVDGLPFAPFPVHQLAVVEGDAKSQSIAAASVVAKVTRDRIMLDYDLKYPEYGFKLHKGYATPQHQESLRRLGPCEIHRRSFAPVRQLSFDF